MAWWVWMILGALLLGSELTIVDAAFYLVFVGAAAILTGALELVGIVVAPWVQWLIFALLSAVSMVFFRQRLYNKLRVVDTEYPSGLGGEMLDLDVDLAPGDKGRQFFRGSHWTVANEGEQTLSAGSRISIERVDGNTLILK